MRVLGLGLLALLAACGGASDSGLFDGTSGGQTTPHAPQSMHRSGSITWIWLRVPVIASVGQRFVQAVQPIQVSIIL